MANFMYLSIIFVTFILLENHEFNVNANDEINVNANNFSDSKISNNSNMKLSSPDDHHQQYSFKQRRHFSNRRHFNHFKDVKETTNRHYNGEKNIDQQRHHHHHHRSHHQNNQQQEHENHHNHHHQHHHRQHHQHHHHDNDEEKESIRSIYPIEVVNKKHADNSQNPDQNIDTDYLNDDNFSIDLNIENHNLLHSLPVELNTNNNNNNLYEQNQNTKYSNEYQHYPSSSSSNTHDSNGNSNNDSSSSSSSGSSSSSSNNNNNNNNNNGIKCPKCSGSTNKVRVSEEELTELRIDFVKRQILQKLRLKEKPQVTGINFLPKPITEREYESAKPKENLDDYYARTSKKFLILERETKECARFNKNPSICFAFKIDDVDVDSIDVNQAVLWLHKKQSHKDQMKQTLVVSEIDQQQVNLKYLPKIKPIAMTSVGINEGWIKIDIAWPIRKWVGYHELSHLIHISCESCELDSGDGLISLDKEYQPFIVIDTQFRRTRSRQKRSVNCTAGVTECCREKLYISFKEIGWSDWIIQPEGYDAYFCRGSCSSAASIAASNNHYSAFVQKLAQHRGSKNGKEPLELIPCCTAKQFSSLQLFYRDSNNTVTLKTLPNMVIQACGCM